MVNQPNQPSADRSVAATNSSDVLAPYEVGYRKPPRATQFKKGQSGNPRGVRKPMSAPETTAAIMSRLVTVNVNGKRRRVTMQEAMLLSQAKKAIAGDHKAAKLLFAFLEQAPAPEEEYSNEEMEAAFREAVAGFTFENLELIGTYADRMTRAQEKLKAARAKGAR